MKELKEKRGITLIALVITIIVLLILAGVTIATLTGDNGLLQKAGESKEKNQEATALEKIKTEVAGSYNLEGKLDLSQLKTNLKRLNIPDEDIIPTIKDEKETFPVKVKIDNYEYDILEDATVEKPVDFATLESLYGKVVNGYTGYEATDVTEWKLLYVDKENREAIIISSNTLSKSQPTENGIPLISSEGVSYTGSNDVKNTEYGKKYNSLWLEKCETENKNTNAKATAYMCDFNNWKKYKTGKAKYAAGGVTYEILLASFYKKQVKDETIIKDVSASGYKKTRFTWSAPLELYNPSDTYLCASPSDGTGTSGSMAVSLVFKGVELYDCAYTNIGGRIRPVVCLPVSAIEVVGEGDNAVLNYK